ncbi:MAG: glycoside hydrolase family 36 N-terminal domain-containing protein, partial [Clostridium celatum]|nr:glycoside hydrolase family 36 N-terminal domain-containing protein [Clostridium celatum]
MAIIINKEENIFSLNTINTSYVFGIDDEGLIRSLYWGRKINHIDDFELIKLEEVSTNDPVYEITPEEYPVYGGLRYKEHCLKVNFNDGTRELKYKYIGYSVVDNSLLIKLRDEYYNLEINLHYIIHEKYDLIERYVTLKNNTSESIEIEKIYSGQFHIPYENLNFRNVHGHWGAEQQMFTQKVGYGKIYIENRRGISTHNHNPYFI